MCKITKKIRRPRFDGHCYTHEDKMTSRTILWQPAHGMARDEDQRQHT